MMSISIVFREMHCNGAGRAEEDCEDAHALERRAGMDHYG
jgi:hypothetical protein